MNADAALLDALASGAAVPPEDELAVMLAAWRDDLGAGLPPVSTVDDTPTVAARTLPGPAEQARARQKMASRRVTVQPALWRPATRRLVAAAAILVAFCSGISLASGNAGPGSPLWPVAQVVYPDRSQVRAVEDLLNQARTAAAQGRYQDAERLLDRAAGQIVQLNDRNAARRLIDQLNQIRASLPTAVPPGVPAPGSSTVPGGAGAPSPTPQHGGGQTGQPAPAPTGGGGLPLPTLPLPSLPVPKLPLPSLPLIG
ncbi:MAG: hypothetical protein J2P15_03695 [Micromonosporaceae bacterium]|nr:hypothetical protein [Micromonosporaceae bacterium]